MFGTNDGNSSRYSNEKAVKRLVRQLLKNNTFVGHFIEQRYLAEFRCYKKIIQISKTESTFIENLSVAKRKLELCFEHSKWIGITFPDTPQGPVGCNLWVDLDEQIFGTYTFLVKNVDFEGDKISLKLQIIKSVNEKFTSRSPSENSIDQSSSWILGTSNHSLMNQELETTTIISWNNLKEVSIFMFLLAAAIVTGGGKLLMFLMDYTLKLTREFSNIIRVIVPIFTSLLDTISKMFGSLCFLLAMLWRDRHGPPKGPLIYPKRAENLTIYGYQRKCAAIDYRPKSSVTIRELHD